MADPASTDSEIIKVSEVPLWYRSLQVALIASLIGLGISLGVVIYNYYKADAVSDIFRQTRRPILQYRLEKGAWPSNFTFDKAPADLEAYDFSTVARGVRDLEVRGTWQFIIKSPDGRTAPRVIFKPEEDSLSNRRTLFAVDAQLDDGKENSGRLLVVGGQAEFTLMGE